MQMDDRTLQVAHVFVLLHLGKLFLVDDGTVFEFWCQLELECELAVDVFHLSRVQRRDAPSRASADEPAFLRHEIDFFIRREDIRAGHDRVLCGRLALFVSFLLQLFAVGPDSNRGHHEVGKLADVV